MKKITLILLITAFVAVLSSQNMRDGQSFNLYYDNETSWGELDVNDNIVPTRMVFSYNSELNFNYNLNKLFGDEMGDCYTLYGDFVDFKIYVDDVIQSDIRYSNNEFRSAMASVSQQLFTYQSLSVGAFDVKFELIFDGHMTCNWTYYERLSINKTFFILNEYKDLCEDISLLNIHQSSYENSSYSHINNEYINNYTGDKIIYFGSQNPNPNSSVIMIEGFDFFNSGAQLSYFTNSSIYDEVIVNNDIYYIQFHDTQKDMRYNALSVVRAISKIHEIRTEDRPFTIIGFSAGGVIARFALAWMEEVGLQHFTNHLIMVDSPLRGAYINQDIQTALYSISGDEGGTDIGNNNIMITATSIIKNTLRSSAARQMLRNNKYASGTNITGVGSDDALYFYSYLNLIDREYLVQNSSMNPPNTLNNDVANTNNKPGYPYKQNNIKCSAVSLGSLLTNGVPSVNGEEEILLSLYLDIESSYYANATVFFWEPGTHGYNNVGISKTIYCNDDSDYWPGGCLPISSESNQLVEYELNLGIGGALLNINAGGSVEVNLGLSVMHNSTFIPTFSALDLQSDDFNFALTSPEDIPRQITFNHLSSSPMNIDDIYYQRTNHVQHAYSSYDYSQLRNNSNHCFINDYLENSNNPTSPFGISSHYISGNIISNDGSPLVNTTVTITSSNNEDLGITVTDGNGYYSIPIYTIDSHIDVKAQRNDFYTQYLALSISASQYEYSADLTCLPIDNEVLFVSENLINGREYFGSIHSAMLYVTNNIPENIDRVVINLLSDITNEDYLQIMNTSVSGKKIVLKGNNRTMSNKLILLSEYGDIEILKLNFQGANQAIDTSYLLENTSLSLVNCKFKNNNQAIFFEYLGINNNINIETCTFTNNSNTAAYSDDYDLAYLNTDSIIGVGGAIYINGGNTLENAVTIDNCTFGDNHAKVGGAIFVKGIPELTIENSTFIDNYIDSENIVYNGIYKASSIYIHETNLNLNHNIFDEFVDNSTFMSPDALLSLSGNSELYSLNNTYINNYSGRSILCYDNSQISCINDIFLTKENVNYAVGCYNGTQSELSNCIIYGYASSNPVPMSSGYEIVDPLLDSNYRPIWTLAQQSPCIEAGVRDLDGDGSWWFEDKDDQDIYGTRPEIGAIPADMDGWGHVLPANQVRWICFPYTLNDPSRYELTHYLEGAQVNFINHDYTNNPGTSPNTPVFGQKGFKIRAFANDYKIDHFGKPVGHPLHYPSGNQIILSRLPFAQSGSNLIGYYKEDSCNPMDAFQNLLDSGMIESVKGEDWTIYYGYPQSPKGDITDLGWHLISHTGKRPSLDLGEAVDVVYCGDSEQIEFNWSDGLTVVPKVKSIKPVTFTYQEKENYLPLQVKIADFTPDKSSEPFGELGVYINGQCKGAGIIADSVVTVFAYLDSLVLTENDTISFVMHDYHDSKNVKKFADYRVYDSIIDNYVEQISHKINDEIVFFDLVSKDDQQSNVIPVVTEIRSIYPNPFNPETTIEFNLKENSDVNIRVYNLKGQLVKTVINSKFEAGNHKVVWNGTNSNEQKVASGLYFCRMETKDKSVTKKMILMK